MGLIMIPVLIGMMVVDAFMVRKDETDEPRWYEQK
jgi:cytosine/uracil/thiamine/allantoin permease